MNKHNINKLAKGLVYKQKSIKFQWVNINKRNAYVSDESKLTE